MSDDQLRFLALTGQPPARLTAEQAAWLINCQPHDIRHFRRCIHDWRANCSLSGMATRFVDIDRDTALLLPPDLRDWVPASRFPTFRTTAA